MAGRHLDGEPQLTGLDDRIPSLHVALQPVDDSPRCHVDLETDDVATENDPDTFAAPAKTWP